MVYKIQRFFEEVNINGLSYKVLSKKKMANKLKLRKRKYPPPYEESENSHVASYTENKESEALLGVDIKDEPENSSKAAKFIFDNGDVRFEEDNEGNILCGGCKRSFKRIIGHLSNSVECAHKINLSELKSEWQNFTQKRRTTTYENKKKLKTRTSS